MGFGGTRSALAAATFVACTVGLTPDVHAQRRGPPKGTKEAPPPSSATAPAPTNKARAAELFKKSADAYLRGDFASGHRAAGRGLRARSSAGARLQQGARARRARPRRRGDRALREVPRGGAELVRPWSHRAAPRDATQAARREGRPREGANAGREGARGRREGAREPAARSRRPSLLAIEAWLRTWSWASEARASSAARSSG